MLHTRISTSISPCKAGIGPFEPLLFAIVLLLSGCGHFAAQPLEVLSYVGDATSHKNLFVFVPYTPGNGI